MTQLEELHQHLAGALNETPEAIKAATPAWLNLMKEGVLVSLHLGRWRAKSRLTWQDLGLEVEEAEEKELEDIMALGYKKLLPAGVIKELDSIESAARKWLEKKAYRTYWGFFVPVTAYEEWKKGNEEYRQRYFAARDALVADHDQIVDGLHYSYRLAARSAYQRLKKLNPKSVRAMTEDEFAKNFTYNIMAHLESATTIRASFYFDVELRYVPLPSLLAEEMTETARQQAAAQIEWAKAEAVKEKERIEVQAEADRAWAERSKLAAEVQAAKSAAQWKEQLMKDMHRDLVDQARAQKQQLVDGFLRDVVVQLRSLVYEASTDVLGAIAKNDHLPPRSVVQLRNLVDQVRGLNFYGDAEIDDMIGLVAGQLDQKAEDRNVKEIERNLVDIATVVRASLIGLGEQPRAARDLGVADAPTAEMIRTARRGLGLEEPEVAETAGGLRQARLSLS
jgi:hypothetical protein